MRILGLDYGSKTVGVAVTDPTGLIAQPLITIKRDREAMLRRTLKEIERLASEYQAELVVLGLPLNMDGSEGERAEKTREFHSMLLNRLSVPVELVDERLTTMEAREILDESGIPRSGQKAVIDQLAAQIILESYLNDGKYAEICAENEVSEKADK